MFQLVCYIPGTESSLMPDGIPIYGFGVMILLTFLITAIIWGPRRAALIGLPKEKFQDLAILLFLFGFSGARIVYMIQYRDQFPSDIVGLITEFFKFYNGGIVVYGSVFGGLLAYWLFYKYVLKRLGVSGWKLADVAAPLIAFGMAVGRIGCFLNGCCWGQPMVLETSSAPLVALAPQLGQFPIIPAHSRDQVTLAPRETDRMPQIRGLQTRIGIVSAPREIPIGTGDPRTFVMGVESGSEAFKAGLEVGDRVVRLNGEPNEIIVEVMGLPDDLESVVKRLVDGGGKRLKAQRGSEEFSTARVAFVELEAYQKAVTALAAPNLRVTLASFDSLTDMVREPRRGQSRLDLVVDRNGQNQAISFTPRTVPYYPTQVYESVSMLLLTGLLLAFQPFRRHDGQLMVLLMLGYSMHRFLNEALRIEPTYALGLTLSQWISVGIFLAGVGLEVYLRITREPLPPGPQPLSVGVGPVQTELTQNEPRVAPQANDKPAAN
jgi:phosphatidylglycerol---prolipoprotein diacylglyceryl transferase